VQADFCLQVNILAEPVVGEALAALQMIEFCRIRGYTRIILEGDSLIVVQAINRIGENWSRYENIIADIQAVLAGFRS
jgi:ribonuclease HI